MIRHLVTVSECRHESDQTHLAQVGTASCHSRAAAVLYRYMTCMHPQRRSIYTCLLYIYTLYTVLYVLSSLLYGSRVESYCVVVVVVVAVAVGSQYLYGCASVSSRLSSSHHSHHLLYHTSLSLTSRHECDATRRLFSLLVISYDTSTRRCRLDDHGTQLGLSPVFF